MLTAVAQMGVSGGERYLPLTLMGFGGLGPWEIGLVVILVLIVFGAGKLPTIGSSLGQALRNFKKSTKGEETDKNEGKK